MQSITELVKKDARFRFGSHKREMFCKTLATVAIAITIVHPNPGLSFILYPADTNQKYTMGGELCQVQDKVEVTSDTFSLKFTKAQLKYTVQQHKLLATHKGSRFFTSVILGCDLTLRTDHKKNIYE